MAPDPEGTPPAAAAQDEDVQEHDAVGRGYLSEMRRMAMDNVESKICALLEKIPATAISEGWQGEGQWTIAVKAAIVSVGHEFGWLTAGNGCNSTDKREWLYDVVWYQSDRANHMTDVPLVAESEWGRESHIEEDFQKLLVARSRYRIMVFQGSSDRNVCDMFQKMRLWISKFHRTAAGDRYLLAGWAVNHWLFDSHAS